MDTTEPGPARVPPAPEDIRVVLNGTTLTVGGLIALADGEAVPAVAPEARERAARSWHTAQRLAAAGRLYGRGTGVGAHRAVTVDADDESAHGLRLLRSHAGGAGALLPARQVRAMLAIRANQLLAGGSGIHPSFVDALTEALRLGVHPAVNEYGAVGTGDLTALAQTGLTLIGERPWLDGRPESRRSGGPVGGPVGGPADAPDGLLDGRPTAGLYDWLDSRPADRRGPGPVGRTPDGAVGEADTGTGTDTGTGNEPVGGGDGAPVARPDNGTGTSSARPLALAPDAPPTGLPAPDAPPTGLPAPDTSSARLPAPVTLRPGDALALLSSNALALAQAALGRHALDVLLRATHAVAALSLAGVSGAAEAYAAPVHALRPYPGAARAAGEVRRLLGLPDRPAGPGRRIQDPYGFRAFPQVHGCALDAGDRLREVVEVEINCASENPVVMPDGTAAYHHGGFFAAPLGLAVEAAGLALLQTAQLSAARLAALGDPRLTGLPAFLAAGPASSSGTMILEYTANSALAELRACAAPASTGHAVLSHGLEEAAGFAGQAARQLLRATDAYATVLACELVVAVRALRLHPVRPPVAAFTVADAALPDGLDDRPLTADVTAAAELLPRLARL
ncbi:aromatic amino acid ammonia-lyase [Streptomyces sp. NPDC003247]|uniref:aromatic amino acid ammonia-lyase n=1 Tax=Streptomyces sp. NPDC003247 TaxID=3364677 RepID=UPI0036AD13E4